MRTIAIMDRRVKNHFTRNVKFLTKFDNEIRIRVSERRKTLRTAEKLHRKLLKMGADRNTLIVGIGGGVVTDLVGFVASTYMRGVRFGFIPTTLLGQVDAAIGGKNGVNLGGYKNIVGTITQPEFVHIDTGILKNLSDREFRSGLAEVVKSAVIGDPELFDMLEQTSFETLRSDDTLLREVIERAGAVKRKIVEGDPFEKGDRKLLNLGHTLGHAIEKSTRKYTHGEAVSIGMALIMEHSETLPDSDKTRILNLLQRFGLPVATRIPLRKLWHVARKDKKGGTIVVPLGIGSCTCLTLH